MADASQAVGCFARTAEKPFGRSSSLPGSAARFDAFVAGFFLLASRIDRLVIASVGWKSCESVTTP
jgi:hypothetical protein